MNSAPTPGSVTRKNGPPAWRRQLPYWGGVLLALVIAVGLWPAAVPVELGSVARGPLVVTVDEEGMTRVKNRYVVTAPVAGQLRRIDWKPGAIVEAGKTVLAVLETGGADFLDARSQAATEARGQAAAAAREAAAAQQARATATAKLFGADFARAQELFAKRVFSRQEFDAAQMRADTAAQDVRAADFALKVAEFELQQARALLTRGTIAGGPAAEPLVITSPVSGKILRVHQESARLVPAGFPLMEVGDPTDLEVRIEVLSRDGVAIHPGAPVTLLQWGGTEPLKARVRLVEPSAFTKISALGVEEQRVYVVADFTDPVERRPTLGDSYRVEARVVIWENPNVLRTPSGSLFQRAGGWQAYVAAGGRAQLRAVKVGRNNGTEAEVLAGLQEGESVILYPGDKVEEGARVRPLIVGER